MSSDIGAASSFSQVLRRLSQNGDLLETDLPEEWAQGRTSFGGLTAALAVEATFRAIPDLPPLRSAQFAFVGPASSTIAFEAQLIRRGKSAAFVDVTASSGDGVALKATLMFGQGRPSTHNYRALPMPSVDPPDTLPDFFGASVGPGFSKQFHAKLAAGSALLSGAAKPAMVLWLKHRDAAAPDNVASVLALGDVPPPAALAMQTSFAPISTMTWSINILAEQFTGAGWHLNAVEADTIVDGYSSQLMTMWDAQGTPVLASRQTVAVFA
jgi:acyl-CoA thioesterase